MAGFYIRLGWMHFLVTSFPCPVTLNGVQSRTMGGGAAINCIPYRMHFLVRTIPRPVTEIGVLLGWARQIFPTGLSFYIEEE